MPALSTRVAQAFAALVQLLPAPKRAILTATQRTQLLPAPERAILTATQRTQLRTALSQLTRDGFVNQFEEVLYTMPPFLALFRASVQQGNDDAFTNLLSRKVIQLLVVPVSQRDVKALAERLGAAVARVLQNPRAFAVFVHSFDAELTKVIRRLFVSPFSPPHNPELEASEFANTISSPQSPLRPFFPPQHPAWQLDGRKRHEAFKPLRADPVLYTAAKEGNKLFYRVCHEIQEAVEAEFVALAKGASPKRKSPRNLRSTSPRKTNTQEPECRIVKPKAKSQKQKKRKDSRHKFCFRFFTNTKTKKNEETKRKTKTCQLFQPALPKRLQPLCSCCPHQSAPF